MSSYVTRDFRITYGSYQVGGSTDRHLDGLMSVRENLGQFTVIFEVWLQRDAGADWATEKAAFEAEFRKRDQRLLIENINDSTTLKDYNPATAAGANTGQNIFAEWEKVGTEKKDTAHSTLYRVTITGDLPADQESGQRDLEVEIDWSSSNRKTVTISGEYTALDDKTATEQYEDAIAAVMSSITSAIDASATWEYTRRNTKRDRNDKVIRFRWVWVERLANQASGTLDHPSIRDSFLVWKRASDAPGDSSADIRRLDRVTALFTCGVDKEVTTDLQALYDDVVLPHIEAELQSEFTVSQFGREVENRDLNEDENSITAVVTFLCAIDATDVVSSSIRSRIIESGGIHYSPAWSGGIFDKYADQGHATRQRQAMRVAEVLGVIKPKERIGTGGGSFFGASFINVDEAGNPTGTAQGTGGNGGLQPSGGSDVKKEGWNLVANDSETERVETGIGPDKIVRTILIERTVEEWSELPR